MRACAGDDPLFVDVPFIVAEAYCAADGLRLCDADEIAAGAARMQGCSGDYSMTWTRTPCVPEEHRLAVVGKPRFLIDASGRKYPECRHPHATTSVAENNALEVQSEVTLMLTTQSGRRPGLSVMHTTFNEGWTVTQAFTGATGYVKETKTLKKVNPNVDKKITIVVTSTAHFIQRKVVHFADWLDDDGNGRDAGVFSIPSIMTIWPVM